MPKKEAMKVTLGENLVSVLVSAAILASAGFCLAITSSNPIVSDLGMLLGRGTLLSMAMVACVLPARRRHASWSIHNCDRCRDRRRCWLFMVRIKGLF